MDSDIFFNDLLTFNKGKGFLIEGDLYKMFFDLKCLVESSTLLYLTNEEISKTCQDRFS